MITVAATLSFLQNTPFVGDIIKFCLKKLSIKFNQPKLSVSIPLGGNKGRYRPDNRMYLPASYPHTPGEPLNYSAQEVMHYFWALDWKGEIHITNNSENTAYKVRLVIPESHEITFQLIQPIDETKPFPPNKTRKYSYVCKRPFVGTGTEADKILQARLGISEINLEYENVSGTEYGTLFLPNEQEPNARNSHYKVGFEGLSEYKD